MFEFSARNMPRFLDDVHIVEALNEPVDDSDSGAKLSVNMGNVFCTDFFSVNFY
jgi:GH35 family endo-1,4-beta-xylanase